MRRLPGHRRIFPPQHLVDILYDTDAAFHFYPCATESSQDVYLVSWLVYGLANRAEIHRSTCQVDNYSGNLDDDKAWYSFGEKGSRVVSYRTWCIYHSGRGGVGLKFERRIVKSGRNTKNADTLTRGREEGKRERKQEKMKSFAEVNVPESSTDWQCYIYIMCWGLFMSSFCSYDQLYITGVLIPFKLDSFFIVN